jgi:hypothetical protein
VDTAGNASVPTKLRIKLKLRTARRPRARPAAASGKVTRKA